MCPKPFISISYFLGSILKVVFGRELLKLVHQLSGLTGRITEWYNSLYNAIVRDVSRRVFDLLVERLCDPRILFLSVLIT